MSIDLPTAIDIGSTVVIVGILVLGIYRALGMRRAFVSGIYRSRATWSTFLMLVIVISMVSNFLPSDSGVLSSLGALASIAFLFVIVAFADRSVLVAMDTDFFHRDTLSWRRARWPAAIVLVAAFMTVPLGGAVLTPAEQSSLLGDILNIVFFAALAVILAYLTAALIVGARRSADRSLRRSLLLLGLALSTLVFSIVVTSFLISGTLPYVIVSQGTGVIGIYLIYRSVMALSPLGRVQKDVGTSSTQIPLNGVPG